jgi:hypothetical protein
MQPLINKAVLIMLICSPVAFSDLLCGVYYNPGLKIGVQFGKHTDFIIGFENSITGALYYGTPFAGLVGGIEFNVNSGEFIKYWEIEGGMAIFGLALGGEWNNGYHGSIRAFGGAGLWFSCKHLFKTRINEISLIGKYPYPFYQVMDHGTFIFGKETKHYD